MNTTVNSNTSALTSEFLARLRAFVGRHVRSAHDTEDIVQDVLAKLVQHDASIDSQSVYAWLFTVARRAIIDRGRSAANRAASPDVAELALEVADDPSISAELARCMEPMLVLLASDERALLQRVDMFGEAQAEVARELGLSVSTVKSRVQRARRRLRGLLENCCTIDRDARGQPAEYNRRPDRPCQCDGCE